MVAIDVSQIKELDASLNTYTNANDWNFYHVEGEQTFQNLTSLYDDELFAETLPNKIRAVIRILVVIGVAVLALFILVTIKQHQELTKYKEMLSVQDEEQAIKLEYIAGEEVDGTTLVAISNELNNYFNTLQMVDFASLDGYCEKESSFNTLHRTYADAVQNNYDIPDCYSKSLDIMAESCKIQSVNHVVEVDGEYYCYATLQIPTEYVMRDYVYADNYNISKYFTSTSVTKENIMKYLLMYMENNKMIYSNNEYLIKMKKKGDNYVIVDDSFISMNCKNTYTEGLNEIIHMIGNK